MGYKHLTKEQRYTIDALLQTPMSLREIGEVIGVSTGTVSREIRRNCDMRGYHRYRWRLAQKKYERRMKGEEMVSAGAMTRWLVTSGTVSHWVTGHRWNTANNYLTLTFEVCCTSKLNSPRTKFINFASVHETKRYYG